MPKVLISTSSFGTISEEPLRLLEKAGFEYQLNHLGRKLTPEETRDLLSGCVGVIAGTEKLNGYVLDGAPQLKVISRVGVGMDGIDFEETKKRGIAVRNTPMAHVDPVAELTLAGLLGLLRRISLSDRRLRRGEWKKPMGSLLKGKTIGILGTGRVGRRFVELLQPFGVTIIARDICPDDDLVRETDLSYCDTDELLRRSDVISVHLSFGPDTINFLNADRLARVKPGAVLVNTSRGELVDETALVEALKDGRLAGAYLDSYQQEPYSGPLTELDNVVLTPHIGSYAAEGRVRMETEAVENFLEAYGEAADR